jgi:hypothetical protein
MAVDMRVYDNIVEQALDVSKTHMEDERTLAELQVLFGRLRVEMEEDALRALMRYVRLSQSRRVDSDFNTFGPGALGGI